QIFIHVDRKSRERRQLPSEINIQVTAPLFTARLYDFGPNEGDQSLPKQFSNAHYNNGLKLRLNRPMHYYGQWFETIFVNGRLVDRAKSEVLYQFDRSIQVSSIILITWEKMQPREGAEAGFSKGTANEYYSLPTSGTVNVMFLKDYGNTGIPGEWMFQVDWHRIIRCKAGVKGDTCDTECSKNEWGEDCEQCCMCKTGNCNAVTGECRNEECETCWTNAPFCNYYDTAKCPPKGTKKCATYAISMYEYTKCGAPVIRCQCMVGYKGDGEKCEGNFYSRMHSNI
ncbi:putative Nidogen-like protein, partial [Trichinella nativa]